MDLGDLSGPIKGVTRLAMVGAVAIAVGFVALVVAVPALIWWALIHVSVAVR